MPKRATRRPTTGYAKSEATLRDLVARNLHLIEHGLKLVQREFPVPNARGAKGFIDILARDIFGHRVVIEIKRSDSTARQALHELHKYVELLQENQGLSSAEVRCILISTDWHELAVPFGAFQRTAKYPVDGLKAITCRGKVSGFEKIDVAAAPSPIRPFRLHSAHQFMDERSYRSFVPRLERALSKVGVTSAVILSMRSKRNRESVMYPYCQYLMICDVTGAARRKYMAKARREAVLTPGDDEIEHLFEDEVTSAVNAAIRTRNLNRTYCFESSWPEKFGAEKDFWNVEKTIRIGRVLNDKLVTDEDVRNHLLGFTGTGQIAYNGIASPAFPAAWRAAKQRAERCLVGNRVWENIAKHTFRLIEKLPGRTTVAFHIYNPCDTIMMLFQLLGNSDARFVPAMEIAWKSDSDSGSHVVSGVLGWDGKARPKSPARMFRRVFDGDWFDYFLARNVGAIATFDAKIMRSHGLSYQAAHFVGKGSKDSGHWLICRNGRFTECDLKAARFKPLRLFVEENIEYVGQLVTLLRSNSFGL